MSLKSKKSRASLLGTIFYRLLRLFEARNDVFLLKQVLHLLEEAFFRFLHTALAAAMATRIRDDFAHAVTGGAGAFGNHLEETARHAAHAPRFRSSWIALAHMT